MKRYDKYKDSGVEWLGEIPEHWDLVKIKYLFDFITGFTPPTTKEEYYNGDLDWVTIADLTSKYVSSSKTRISQTAITDMCKKPIPQGSLMYSFKLSVGKVAFAAKELFTNEAIFSVLPDKTLNLNYYYYALQDILIHNANENIYGAKLLNQELILNSLLPKLSNCEQQKIAEYLDYTVGKIDVMIQSKEAQIERLQSYRKSMINEVVTKGLDPNVAMKDSGVEWLGEIPEHWRISKIKYIAEVKGRIGFKGYAVSDIVSSDVEGRAIVLGGTNITKNGTISFNKLTYLSQEKYIESPEIMLFGGEILITKVGAGVGENAIYNFYEDKVTINPNVMLVVANRTIIDPNFLNLYILSDTVKSEILIESLKSGAQPAINQSFIKGLIVLVPSQTDQSQIINRLRKQTTKIDCIVSELNQQIEKLKEYKTAIISEAVTGKIDLRDWVHP